MFLINPYILQSSALDADAQAFITAASITDTTEKSAINQLVLDLKSASIWTKLHAVYPMVGGNATSHSYNLINTSNYQLTFNGGWTHSSTGALPNGTNAYADTGFNTLSNFSSLSDSGLGFYSRTDNFGIKSDYGLLTTGNFYSYTRYNSTTGYVRFFSTERSISVSNSQGLFSFVCDGTNVIMKRNNSVLRSDLVSGALINNNIIFSATTSTAGFSNRELALTFISKSMSSTDVDNFYTAIQTFQTALSRQV